MSPGNSRRPEDQPARCEWADARAGMTGKPGLWLCLCSRTIRSTAAYRTSPPPSCAGSVRYLVRCGHHTSPVSFELWIIAIKEPASISDCEPVIPRAIHLTSAFLRAHTAPCAVPARGTNRLWCPWLRVTSKNDVARQLPPSSPAAPSPQVANSHPFLGFSEDGTSIALTSLDLKKTSVRTSMMESFRWPDSRRSRACIQEGIC